MLHVVGYFMKVNQGAKLCLWKESVLYIGQSLDPEIHNHNAVQCCLALRGHLLLREKIDQEWQPCHAAIIGANVNHCIRNPDGPIAIIYIEKTSTSFKTIVDFHCTTKGCTVRSSPMLLHHMPPNELGQALSSALQAEITIQQAQSMKNACLKYFEGQITAPTPLSPYLVSVLELIHSQMDKNLSGRVLAERAGVSESRLRHLFKDQIGIPIRRYVLWIRLRRVIEDALEGYTLTEAAHASGFSDSAHFTRTFKAMFGIPPSLITSQNAAIKPLLCDSIR